MTFLTLTDVIFSFSGLPLFAEVDMGCCCQFIILIMSKKPQPQKGEPAKVKAQIVNEQEQPYLRALQKKIRNLNKKLTEIADLQGKDNLKPEQQEKIARKGQILDEITKIEESITAFKQVYAENVVHYRNNQLKELETLARALAIYHSGAKAEHEKLSALWRVIEQSDKNYPTLNDAITAIGNALKDFVNDKKVQKTLSTHVEEHGSNLIKHEQEKIVSAVLEEKKQTKKKEKHHKVEQPEPVPEKKPEPVVVEKVAFMAKEPTPIVEEPPKVEPVAEKVTETVKEEKTEPKQEKDKNYRGKGGFKEKKDGEVRKQYKPKYEEKREGEEKAVERREDDENDSDSSEERGRQFRKDQIHKLQEDGFIVVGKPKAKPKNFHQQQKFHDRQHGKKFHHHNRAGNS